MQYPYYIVPLVERYKTLDPRSEEAKELSRKIAANIGDYASLRLVLGMDPPEFGKFYPDMETTTPSTLDTIDSFLDKFGGKVPNGGYMFEEGSETKEEIEADEGDEVVEKGLPDLSQLLKEKKYEEALELIEAQNLINPEKSIYFAHQISFLKKLIALKKYRNQTKG